MILGAISRYFINDDLEEKASELRMRVANFDNELRSEVNAVVNETKAKNDADLKAIMKSLNKQLQDDAEFMNAVAQPLTKYVELSFLIELLRKKYELLCVQQQRLSSQIGFIFEELKLMDERAADLNETRNMLLRAPREYKDLLLYSGIIEEDKSAMQQLLSMQRQTKDDAERKALSRTLAILKSKCDFQEDIKRIDWVIEQCKNYKDALCAAKNAARDAMENLKPMQSDVERQGNALCDQRLPYAQEIRQKVYADGDKIDEQIENLKAQKSKFYDSINIKKDVNAKLKSYYENPNSWDAYAASLKQQKDSINVMLYNMPKPDEINKNIDELLQKTGGHRMQIVLGVLNQYNVFLIGGDRHDS